MAIRHTNQTITPCIQNQYRILGLWLILLLTVSWLSGCQADKPSPSTIRVGLAQSPMTLDPRYATDAASLRVQQFLHRGLIRLDAHFQPQGDLALRWTHPDALHWQFFIRPNIHFHDGRRLSAYDVEATLRSILNVDMASPLRAGFAAIRQVHAISDDELHITMNKPDSSLLTRLSIGILPARIAKKKQQSRQIIGCGPFKLIHWNQQGLMLERMHPITDHIKRLLFLTVKDPVTRSLKLVRGEIDFTQNDMPPHLLPYLRRQKTLSMQTRPGTTFSYIGLNMQDNTLKDIRVRHALALAVDRIRLKKALFSDLPELAETVLPATHWVRAPLPSLSYDPKQAEKLLDAAGFPRNANGIRFHLNYRTSTDPARLRLATAIASQWHQIGVDVHIESLEWGGFYARIKRGDFQVFSLAWVGIVDPDIYRWILHSDMWPPKGANRGRYANAQVDQWLDQAASSDEQAQRRRWYQQVQQQMHHDQVYIPLWYEPIIAISGSRLHGFHPAPDGNLLSLLSCTINQ